MIELIGKTISHYRILDKLGEGGMGVVYKAEDTKLKRTVALKFLTPQALGSGEQKVRFLREAQAAAALNHSNICTVYEIDESEGPSAVGRQSFIAMEYIEGQNLKEKIESGPLKLDEAVEIAIQVSEGLQKAHDEGVVHRDIKSANIIVTEEGQTKIMDFGIAKLAGSTLVTKEGTTMGTVAYMSPEQARGEALDHRTDIWSLGVVLYEMVTGQLPFKGEYEQAVMYSIMNEDTEPMTGLRTGVPMELERITNKALAKSPDERYQNLDDTLVDLRSVRKQLESLGTKAGLKGRFDRKMLVVLPFENLGPKGDEYFADGLTDEITARLSHINELGIIGRTSAIQYKNTDKTIKQIGKELDVQYILEGTVRWQRGPEEFNRVRITPQLISVTDATHLWAHVLDEEITDIFQIQTDIAEKVAKALDIKLLEPERKSIKRKLTANLEAYDCYLKANDHLNRGLYSDDEQELRQSLKMYEKAVELDDRFAMAYAQLSGVHSFLYHLWIDRTGTRLAYSKAAVDKALELDSDMPEALEALAYYYYHGLQDYELALKTFETIKRSRPNYTPEVMAYILRRKGQWESALNTLVEAFELNPRDAGIARELGGTCKAIRKYDEAEYWYDRALSIEPKHVLAQAGKAWNYLLWKGNTGEARTMLEKLPKIPFVDLHLIETYIIARDYHAALGRVKSLSKDALEYGTYYFENNLVYATIYRFQNKSSLMQTYADRACGKLERAVRENPEAAGRHSALGLAYAYQGRKDKAIEEGKRAMKLCPITKDAVDGPQSIFYLAQIYTIVGELERAIDQLDRILFIPSFWISVPRVLLDPMWDPLRDHPRFKKLLDKEGPVSS